MNTEVYLWGTRIGVVEQNDPTDFARFNYDDRFMRSAIEVSPLVMPLSGQVYSFPTLKNETFHLLPGLLADSLPDKFGTKLLEQYLANQGRSLDTLSAVERLCYTGSRGTGALEYVPAKELIETKDTSIDVDALVQLASEILSDRESVHVTDNSHMMEQIISVGTSAGGARAKAVVAWNRTTGDIRSGQVHAGDGYEYWIIKFDGVENNKDRGDTADGPAFTRIEYAYYRMAQAAGIEMSECRLHEESGKYHFMTKRFDRRPITGEKVHMQSLGAIAHYDFNEPGAHSYEQTAGILYRLNMGQTEVEQLFRRMVFNELARNLDDHVKNISFLMDKQGVWSLSPAYDVTYAFNPSNRWLARHQMTINGKQERITLDDLVASGQHMNISKNRIISIVEDVERSIKEWPTFAKEAKLSKRVVEGVHRNLSSLDELDKKR